MDKKNTYLVIIGLVICILIAVLAPFIASSNPDGLEKSAEDAEVSEDVAYEFIESPFPDYTIGDSVIGEVIALILGIFVTLIIGFGVAYLLKKQKD